MRLILQQLPRVAKNCHADRRDQQFRDTGNSRVSHCVTESLLMGATRGITQIDYEA